MENLRAFAYLRTSKADGSGSNTDSEPRQREAIQRLQGFEVVQCFFDDGVSGTVKVQDRPQFASMLDAIESNGVRVVLVEDASRFARDLVTQETGLVALIERGVKVFASNGDELTETDDPMRIAMRQIAGTFAELERRRLVSKLRVARDRIREREGHCEGRFKLHEIEEYQAAIPLAKRLHRKSPKTGKRRSLRQIAKLLEHDGHVVRKSGKTFSASTVKAMVEGPLPALI